MKVCVYRYQHPRSKRMADAMQTGVRRMGWHLVATDRPAEVERCGADMLIAYGWQNAALFAAYRDQGRQFIYIDLGYWARKNGAGDYSGYHKCVVDARHATEYFRRVKRPHDRMAMMPPLQDPRTEGGRGYYILAGQSAKSAASYDCQPYAWERERIREIASLTDRPIIYRPKPSWYQAAPLPGALFDKTTPIEILLRDAAGLVTLGSNTAIDAMIAGVAFHAEDGIARAASSSSIEELIRSPRTDVDRRQFLADVSYCQWTRHEMESGEMFEQYLADGLIRC